MSHKTHCESGPSNPSSLELLGAHIAGFRLFVRRVVYSAVENVLSHGFHDFDDPLRLAAYYSPPQP